MVYYKLKGTTYTLDDLNKKSFEELKELNRFAVSSIGEINFKIKVLKSQVKEMQHSEFIKRLQSLEFARSKLVEAQLFLEDKIHKLNIERKLANKALVDNVNDTERKYLYHFWKHCQQQLSSRLFAKLSAITEDVIPLPDSLK